MAQDLTANGTITYVTGLFGKAISNSNAVAPTGLVPNCTDAITVSVRLKGTSPGSLTVALGQGGALYMGMAASGGLPVMHFPPTYDSGNGGVSGAPAIGDNAWHELRFCADSTGYYAFLDGALVTTGATAWTPYTGPEQLHIGNFNDGFNWTGLIEELAIYSVCKNKTAYTPRVTAIPDTDVGLVALYHFDDNLLDTHTAPVAATAITLIGPASGTVGAASGNFTIGANGSITGTVRVTPSGTGAGSFTPAFVDISDASPTGTFTRNKTAAGAETVTVANNGGLTNPAGVSYTATATDTTAPTFLGAQISNSAPNVIVVTMSEALAASTPPASAFPVLVDGQARTVSSVAVSGSTASLTLASAVTAGQAVTFAYNQPGANPRLQDATGNATVTQGATAVTNNVNASATAIDTSKMIFSPGNWALTSTSARAINAGAYWRARFTGSSIALNFNMTGATNPSKFWYRIDRGPLIEATVAATVALSVPAASAGWADAGGHLVEFYLKSRTNYIAGSWDSNAIMVALTGIVLDAGKSLVLPQDKKPLSILIDGDSITEGQEAVGYNLADALVGYAFNLGEHLGAEIGVIGFGGQGWTAQGGGGTIPAFPNTYDKIFSGVDRDFTGIDAVIINQGTNDGSNTIQPTVVTVLNGLLAKVPPACKIIVMRPFNGNGDAQIVAAIAQCSAPARVSHMDTTGFFNTANSGDGIHPYGNEHITHIAPLVAAATRAILAGASVPPTLYARTVSATLKSFADVARANLTNLKWTWRDSFTGAILSSGTTGTTNGAGLFSVSVQTTLASGGIGWLEITDSDGTLTQNPVAKIYAKPTAAV